MKNLNEVLELLNKAVLTNSETRTWFFSFSGHVNQIDVRLYPKGWRAYDELDELGQKAEYFTNSSYLDNQETLTELYYWIKLLIENKL